VPVTGFVTLFRIQLQGRLPVEWILAQTGCYCKFNIEAKTCFCLDLSWEAAGSGIEVDILIQPVNEIKWKRPGGRRLCGKSWKKG
jgi:hypothetical protein